MKEWSAGGPYEKPGKAPAASLTLLVTVRVSVHREEETGRWVNSGSKCRRSVGPLCKTKHEGQALGKMSLIDVYCNALYQWILEIN